MRTPYIYGMTNLYSALSRIRTDILREEAGNRAHVQDVAILLTDGRSNINTRLTASEARQLKAAGLTIAAIGIHIADLRELRTVVSDPVDRFLITVDHFEELVEMGPRLAHGLCRGKNVNWSSWAPVWHMTYVEVRTGGVGPCLAHGVCRANVSMCVQHVPERFDPLDIFEHNSLENKYFGWDIDDQHRRDQAKF